MRLTDAARTHVHPIATPDPSHRCTDWCVSPPLPLGQGGDEFAAEVGNVGDHAAPDQVRSDREKLEQVFAGLLGWDINRSPLSIGVLMGVVRDQRGDGRWVAYTAFS